MWMCYVLFFKCCRQTFLVVEAFVLLAILVVNIYVLAWDDKLKRHEHIAKTKTVLKQLRGRYNA